MMISAVEPPEAHGVARDGVRMLVARPSGVTHAHFTDLARFLRPGDLVVVNNSGTMAAAVDGELTVHFSTWLDDGSWVVELRPEGTDGFAGQRIELPTGYLELVSPYVPGRLWRACVSVDVPDLLARFGRPIKYAYVPRQWPISDYQTGQRQRGDAQCRTAVHRGAGHIPCVGRSAVRADHPAHRRVVH
jgi:S-adenosylmethionine:tRNA ribosyltransferase-isomerase